MIFPRLVYKSASDHMLVQDQDEFDLQRKKGWFATVPEAITGAHDVADEGQPTREELEQKASELALKFDGRTSDAKLGKMIEEALRVVD